MIADRVVLGRFAPRAIGWLGVVVGVYAIADLADALAGHVPWSRLPLRWPAMCFQGMPVALAAAAAHTVTALRRSGEWTALGAAGVGPSRRLGSIVILAALLSLAAWGIGDRVAPVAAKAYRAAGGGAPPGAVVLPLPAAGWTRRADGLERGGPVPVVVRFDPGDGPPVVIVRAAPGEAAVGSATPATIGTGVELARAARGAAAVRPPTPATDATSAELARLARSAGDALPYALEAAFRPLIAGASLLLPLLVLAFVVGRPLGPRSAAAATIVLCGAAYAIVAGAFSLAAAGVFAPHAAALGAASLIVVIAAGCGIAPRTDRA